MAGNWALVVTQDPIAADIFKRTEFLGVGAFAVGEKRRVKKPSWNACEGIIVSIGTQSAMKKIHVSPVTGQIMQDNDTSTPVQNRFQELAKRKKAASFSAREAHLQNVSITLLRAGPSDKLNPATGRSSLRLPKKFSEQHCAALRQELKTLRCWRKYKGDARLSSDHKVYLPGSALIMEQCIHPKSPSLQLRGVLAQLVPPTVRSNLALSWSGSRNTVKLPTAIVQVANVAVLNYFHQKEIDIDYSVYNLRSIVKNFLYSNQHPNPKTGTGSTSHLQDEEAELSLDEEEIDDEVIDEDFNNLNEDNVDNVLELVDSAQAGQAIRVNTNTNTDGSFLAPLGGFNFLQTQ